LHEFNNTQNAIKITIVEESITKIFSEYNVRTAFKTTNTLENILKPTNEKNKYDSSGIYKLKCLASQSLYIGQTDRHFKARYTEHIGAGLAQAV
jgi:cobalamin biosynthesis Co2+ chelatase CbiK